jgi:hypothetical protein
MSIETPVIIYFKLVILKNTKNNISVYKYLNNLFIKNLENYFG